MGALSFCGTTTTYQQTGAFFYVDPKLYLLFNNFPKGEARTAKCEKSDTPSKNTSQGYREHKSHNLRFILSVMIMVMIGADDRSRCHFSRDKSTRDAIFSSHRRSRRSSIPALTNSPHSGDENVQTLVSFVCSPKTVHTSHSLNLSTHTQRKMNTYRNAQSLRR